jgi:hypothetical protein
MQKNQKYDNAILDLLSHFPSVCVYLFLKLYSYENCVDKLYVNVKILNALSFEVGCLRLELFRILTISNIVKRHN